jgi:hypothetical protein
VNVDSLFLNRVILRLHQKIKIIPLWVSITLPSSKKLNFDAKQRAELMLKMHETTKENIERMNAKYKISGEVESNRILNLVIWFGCI